MDNEQKPKDAQNVEFVPVSAKPVDAKLKMNPPAKSPIKETTETVEAVPAVPSHVPPINVTADKYRNTKDSFSHGMAVKLTAVVDVEDIVDPKGAKFIISEDGATMDAQPLVSRPLVIPQPPPVKVELVDKPVDKPVVTV